MNDQIDYEKAVKEKYPDAECRIAQRTANKAIYANDDVCFISDSVSSLQEAWESAYIYIKKKENETEENTQL